MNIRHILPLIAVTAVVMVGSLKPVLRAQQTLAGGGPMRGMLGRLHLTDEQKKAGRAVLRTHQPAIKPLVDGLVQERAALRTLFKAPAVDEAAIRAQSTRVATIEADLAVQRAYLVHDLRALATPAQLQTLETVQSENAARRSEIVQRINAWITNS